MKLISMKDFTLEQGNKVRKECLMSPHIKSNLLSNFIFSSVKYAHFLNTPLTLGMFVPCGEDGKPLEEPIYYKSWVDNKYTNTHTKQMVANCENYQQAKERVLFEGVEIEWCKSQLSKEQFYGVTVNGQWCGGYSNFISTYLKSNETIEGLTNLVEKLKPTLTESAIKKLGL